MMLSKCCSNSGRSRDMSVILVGAGWPVLVMCPLSGAKWCVTATSAFSQKSSNPVLALERAQQD